jgi:hypothetical protein
VKVVEMIFERQGRIVHLHVGGAVIRTTGEHPFYVRDKGWTPAGALQPGDLLASESETWQPVQEIFDTGEFETVYNITVSAWHTYFVRTTSECVWAHNVACGQELDIDENGPRYGVRERGRSVPGSRPGSNGHPDHQQAVQDAAEEASALAREGETVLTQARIRHDGSTRIPDVQIVDANGKTRRVIEIERRPGHRYNQVREAEYEALGLEYETRVLSPR